MTEGLYSRRYQERERIIVPYPFLSEGAEVTIGTIANTYLPLPEGGGALNQWYRASVDTVITIPAGKTLLFVEPDPATTGQLLVWDTAPAGAAQTRSVDAGEYLLIYDGTRIPISLAGFPTLLVADDSGASPARSYLIFPPHIRFAFTPLA